ncbi:MAG: hypothetical protein ACJ8C4_16330 [Gemmataceae bacterium]
MAESGEFPIDPGFVFRFPLYTFVTPYGPGMIAEVGGDMKFAPIWTDWDLYRTYMDPIAAEAAKKKGHPVEIPTFEMKNVKDLIAYLRTIPSDIENVAIDPVKEIGKYMSLRKVHEFLRELEGRYGGSH